MQILFLVPEYLVWHYSKALRLHLNIVTNFIWFTYHFFSVPIMFQTLPHPWHSRAAFWKPVSAGGPIVRAATLFVGLVFCGVVAVVGAALFLLWLVLPIVVLVLIFEAGRIIVS